MILVLLLLAYCLAVRVDPGIDVADLVRGYGYRFDNYTVITEDGYHLGLFRVRNSSAPANGKATLLAHGLLDSAFTWFVNLPTESLPYLLADKGFDVFLCNSRGNRYSLGHTPPIDDATYWDGVDIDTFAKYDLPANLQMIRQLSKTKHGVYYVGHSQGTTQMFAALTSGSVKASDLSLFAGLGPVAFVSHQEVVGLTILADINLAKWLQYLGEEQFLPSFQGPLAVLFAGACAACGECCDDLIELICGPHSPNTFNDTRLPLVIAHEPGGTSVRNMQHWTQFVNTGVFGMFDYGSAQLNFQYYGQDTPPVYDFANYPASVPTFLWSGSNDLLADPDDVALLDDSLTEVPLKMYQLTKIQGYAHLDFAWAVNARTVLYDDIISIMRKL